MHRLVDLCDPREVRSLREEFSQLRSLKRSRFPAPPPSPTAPSGAPHVVPPPLPPPGASPPVSPPPIAHEVPRPDRPSVNHCRRSGCSFPVPPSCPVGYCQTHCTSPRCLHSTPTRRCRARGCSSLVPRSCVSGHRDSTSARCTLHRRRVRACSTLDCSAEADPRCVVGSCRAHCTHTECGSFGGGSQPTAPAPVVLSMDNQTEWGREPGEHRTVTPSHALHMANFNARRLWLHDEAIHDGFPMLSRILLSENVGVCCIQELHVISPHSLWINRTYMMDLVGPEDGRQGALLASLCVSAHPMPPILASMSILSVPPLICPW